jgi:hypothetical protein
MGSSEVGVSVAAEMEGNAAVAGVPACRPQPASTSPPEAARAVFRKNLREVCFRKRMGFISFSERKNGLWTPGRSRAGFPEGREEELGRICPLTIGLPSRAKDITFRNAATRCAGLVHSIGGVNSKIRKAVPPGMLRRMYSISASSPKVVSPWTQWVGMTISGSSAPAKATTSAPAREWGLRTFCTAT